MFLDLCTYDLVHVVGCNSHNLRDLTHVSWVGSVLWTDPAQPLTMTGEELDDLLYIDR